jgi:hypothetical protein
MIGIRHSARVWGMLEMRRDLMNETVNCEKTKNNNGSDNVIMDCLKFPEFFREGEDIGAEAGDKYHCAQNDEFLNMSIVFFDFCSLSFLHFNC